MRNMIASGKSHNRAHYSGKGFTLIEMMVVLVILGILAMIAIPAYQTSIAKSRRADAQGALLSFANAMERHFTTNGTYMGAGTTDQDGDGVGDSGAPTIFSTTSPTDGGTAFYNLTIQNDVDATTYTLIATPIGAQADDGKLGLSNTGVRSWDKNNDGDFNDTGETTWEQN